MADYNGYLTGKRSGGDGFPYTVGNRGVLDTAARSEYARGNFYHCFTCGGIIPESAFDQHHNWHLIVNKKGNGMSQVAWCDPGNHPFKAGAPGSADYTASVTDEDGNRKTIVMDACADHSPFNPPAVKERKAIEAELREEYPIG